LVSVCPQQPVYTFSVKLWSILSCRFYHTKWMIVAQAMTLRATAWLPVPTTIGIP
jgi:hypothetical protein